MSYRDIRVRLAALVFTGFFAANVNAAVMEPVFDFTFNFTGECDDCAFSGDPTDAMFDPLNDGLTETVTATLILTGISLSPDGLIEYRGAGDARFNYHGSSLINAFTLFDPFLFTTALTPTGQVQPGNEFIFESSQNAANPDISFRFSDFCTPLGRQVLDRGGFGACDNIGLVGFSLDSVGNFAVFGNVASDIGTGGGFTTQVSEPATIWLFGSALLGLFGASRFRKSV